MSMEHMLVEPDRLTEYGRDAENISEEIIDKLREMDALVKSIKEDKDYKSTTGSDALIAAAEEQYPMLNAGAATVARYSGFGTYVGQTTQATDEDIASSTAGSIMGGGRR